MKKEFSWLSTSLLSILVCLLAFTACSDDDPVYHPTLKLEHQTLTLSGSGESLQLNYNVTDAPGGFLLPQVSLNADWIRVTDHTALGTLTLEADPMPLNVEGRSATLTLTLPEYPDVQATCTLTQDPNTEEFYIDIQEVLSDRVIYSIQGKSGSDSSYRNYISLVLPKAQADTLLEQPKQILYAAQARQKQWYKDGLSKYSNIASYSRYAPTYPGSELALHLEPGCDYSILTFGFSGSLFSTTSIGKVEIQTPVTKRDITTPAQAEVVTPQTLEVQVDVKGAFASCTFKGSSDMYFFFENVEGEGEPDLNQIRTPEQYCSQGVYYKDMFGTYVYTNTHWDCIDVTMRSNTTYTLVARGYDRYLHPLTDWMYVTYRTTDPQQIDISFSDVTSQLSDDFLCWEDCAFKSSVEVPVKAYLVEASELEGKDEAWMAEKLMKDGRVTTRIGFQTHYYHSQMVIPDCDYSLLVAASADQGKVLISPVTSIPLHSHARPLSSDLTLESPWAVWLDGDAYADAYNAESARGTHVLSVGLRHSAAATYIYNGLWNEYVTNDFNPEGENWIYYYYCTNYRRYPTSNNAPIVYLVPKTMCTGTLYFVGFSATSVQCSEFLKLPVDCSDMKFTSIDEYQKLVEELYPSASSR